MAWVPPLVEDTEPLVPVDEDEDDEPLDDDEPDDDEPDEDVPVVDADALVDEVVRAATAARPAVPITEPATMAAVAERTRRLPRSRVFMKCSFWSIPPCLTDLSLQAGPGPDLFLCCAAAVEPGRGYRHSRSSGARRGGGLVG